MDALGKEAFSGAYRFLKHFEEVSASVGVGVAEACHGSATVQGEG